MRLSTPLVVFVGTAGLAFAGTLAIWQGVAGAADDTAARTTLSPATSAGGSCEEPASAVDLSDCRDADSAHGVYDVNKLDPTTQKWLNAAQGGGPGEMSVYIEGSADDLDPTTIRECRESLATGTDGPLGPLYCNALVLMADGKIPTEHHYTESELRQLAE